MISDRALRSALGARTIADWVVVQREQHVGYVDEASDLRRAERRHRAQLTVHHDAPSGRGSAHVVFDAAAESLAEAVRHAELAARISIGAAWQSAPLAAPARVRLADPTLQARDPLEVASELTARLGRPAGASVDATVEVVREHVEVTTRRGLRFAWDATRVRADLLVALDGRSVIVSRQARRLVDLGLDAAIGGAIDDLALRARAGAAEPGRCAVVLRAEAMLHDELGVWSAFEPHADAERERRGLTRYRQGLPVAAGAEAVAEPLDIVSDGALDHGLRSAPLGDEGEAVRRFPLITRGVAAGLSLSSREAALRGRDPNGGVRNLVVALGGWDGSPGGAGDRVLEVRRLSGLWLDPLTGDAALEIALGLDHTTGAPRPFTGGSLRVDLVAALATARRSATTLRRGSYVGPDAVLLPSVDLLA